ncbi:myosin'myosin' [Cryptosporidium canis]|uniref:Myosin'myosin n=1 Tax=Cryptosporidium canis TaxID=195482 RepID=A0A9D5DES2_9CRYT|nr:myosin'myosin' [Cryptosporidium canis]
MQSSRDLDSGPGLFGPGSLVWIPCPREVWRPGVVSRVDDSQVVVRVSDAVDELTLEEVSEEVVFKLPLEGGAGPQGGQLHIRAAEQLSECGVVTPDDLCELTHLHQPSILHAINTRFDLDKIYTYTGPILIAVNPYRRLEGFYSLEMIQRFRSAGDAASVPHVFGVANKAYSGVCSQRMSQTILISGESGAGKTETTKFVLQFLTVVGGSAQSGRGSGLGSRGSSVEDQIIQSNPLLEAFGNSQTLRNNNSSRFGKFIEVQFADSASARGGEPGADPLVISSACINTYLLEKVRVCHQQKGERNFHIFYQLCSAAKHMREQGSSGETGLVYRFPSHVTDSVLFSDKSEALSPQMSQIREQLFLNPMEIDLSHITSERDFRYLEGSECQDSDFHQFERTLYAMRTMGISNKELYNIIKVIKAVMFLGNVVFEEHDSESSAPRDSSSRDLEMVASLLSLPREEVVRILTLRKIQLREGEVMKHLSVQEAETTKDAVAKALYSLVFDYILYLVNSQISRGAASEASHKDGEGRSLYCGILDIFGFECFPINSFEQLCINFANERLQQIFNDYIFNIEQDLYIQEEISWDPIDFPDNGDCVQLLQQQKPVLGVLPAIDEECFVPQGSNMGLLNKLVKEYSGKNSRFEMVKKKPDSFVIVHYAGPVSYCVENFIEKNKDQLSPYSTEVLSSSGNPWISDLLKARFLEGSSEPEATTKSKRPKTLGSSFRTQLNKLVSTIKQTNPHFIRCIKPNSNNSPDEFDRASVSEQLKYGGVLQAIQVSRAGYPVRYPHQEFLLDYMILFSPCGQLSMEKSRDDYERWRRSILRSVGVKGEEEESSGSQRKGQITELMESLSSCGLISGDRQTNQWAVGTTRSAGQRYCLHKDPERVEDGPVRQQTQEGGPGDHSHPECLERDDFPRIHCAPKVEDHANTCQTDSVKMEGVFEEKGERGEAVHPEGVFDSVDVPDVLAEAVLCEVVWERFEGPDSVEGQLFAKYQEALIEIQRLKVNCSRLEDQLYKAQSERNAIREEKEQLSQELLAHRGGESCSDQGPYSQNINSSNSVVLEPHPPAPQEKELELVDTGGGEDSARQSEIIKRLLRLSSYPFSKLELLESIPEVLFPRDSHSIMLNYQDRQIGLLFTGSSSSGDKTILKKFVEETGAGYVDNNSLQVFTIELSNIPGAHVMSTRECLRGSSYALGGDSGHKVRDSSIGERWPLNIMSITSLEEAESLQQIEGFLPRTRVAVFVYDVSDSESFETLRGPGGDFGILKRAIESGCRVVLFGSLYRVIHESAAVRVDIEQVRRISCDLDIVAVESDSVSSLISSIVGIINARTHSELKVLQSEEASAGTGSHTNRDELALALERSAMQQKQLNSSLLSKFNDGIRAFGLRIPKFPASKPIPERNEFLLASLDIEDAADPAKVDKQGGIGPVINIKDDQNSSVTHIVFCRDIPTEPHTMLLVARKNGVIHAYYCYKTRLEDGVTDENSSPEWSGRVEEAYSRKAHNRAITSLALSPDESEFLSTSIDMTFWSGPTSPSCHLYSLSPPPSHYSELSMWMLESLRKSKPTPPLEHSALIAPASIALPLARKAGSTFLLMSQQSPPPGLPPKRTSGSPTKGECRSAAGPSPTCSMYTEPLTIPIHSAAGPDRTYRCFECSPRGFAGQV